RHVARPAHGRGPWAQRRPRLRAGLRHRLLHGRARRRCRGAGAGCRARHGCRLARAGLRGRGDRWTWQPRRRAGRRADCEPGAHGGYSVLSRDRACRPLSDRGHGSPHSPDRAVREGVTMAAATTTTTAAPAEVRAGSVLRLLAVANVVLVVLALLPGVVGSYQT